MNVCVYCASSTKIAEIYFAAARQLGSLLAQERIGIINGAGNIGLMGALSDAALAEGGTVTGVIPHFMVEQGWNHTGLSQLIEVKDMHERKQTWRASRMPSLPCLEAAGLWRSCWKLLPGNN